MLVLVGKTASGKDTIKKELLKMGMEDIVTCTTRPVRPGEVNGVSYHFFSKDEFLEKEKQGFFAEYTKYFVANGDTWYYGTAKRDVSDDKAIILNPDGLKQMKEQKDLKIVSFYIYAPDDVLLQRLKLRGDNEAEYKRRLKRDKVDFEGMESLVDCVVENIGDKSPEELARFIKESYEELVKGEKVPLDQQIADAKKKSNAEIEAENLFGPMREATAEEQKSVMSHIRKASEPAKAGRDYFRD